MPQNWPKEQGRKGAEKSISEENNALALLDRTWGLCDPMSDQHAGRKWVTYTHAPYFIGHGTTKATCLTKGN